MIRTFIADDHDIVREGISSLINAKKDIMICGVADSGLDLLDKVISSKCDVLVLDVNMPKANAIDIIKSLKKLENHPAVVVFSMYKEDSLAVSYLRAGAMAYISKRKSTSELIKAIRTAATGKRYITPALAEYLFEREIDLDTLAHEKLSDRELEVFRSLIVGESAKKISTQLQLKISTVNTFIQRIKCKLGVESSADIIQYARDNELL
jgi:DNA-binding NarL/FixJ family response regulator